MNIGVVVPQIELGGDAGAAREFAQAVEDLGFDHILAYDHVLGAEHANRAPQLAGPYTERDPFHDPFTLFAHLAAVTTRLGFATGILVLPQRQTSLVARQATDVDLFSDGRLRLGVGIGWNYVEYQALGQEFSARGARQEEQIVLLRELFSGRLVDFTGKFHRVDRACLVPAPTRRIPIWLGGGSAAAFDRAARLADGFIIGGGIDRACAALDDIRNRLPDYGRSADDFGGDYILYPTTALEHIADEVITWRQMGGTHVSVVTTGRGFTSLTEHLEFLAALNDLLALASADPT